MLLFGVFGVGALAISPFIILLPTLRMRHALVMWSWKIIVWMFKAARLISVETTGREKFEGCVIVSNHPSLIDVVLLTVLIPKTLYVAKHALLKNPVMSLIVGRTSLPDDGRLLEAAVPLIKKGWNVLIFPEGTRSPSPYTLHPLRRGAAQLALRAGAPIVCVSINLSRAILGKRQPPWDVGGERVACRFTFKRLGRPQPVQGVSMRHQSIDLTREIKKGISPDAALRGASV